MLLYRYLLSNKSIRNFNVTQRTSLNAVEGSPLLSFGHEDNFLKFLYKSSFSLQLKIYVYNKLA